MNTGALRLIATLEAGDDNTPLDPPDWPCALTSELAGGTILVGRFHPGISVHTRVHLRGRVYHVDHVINRDERDTELVLTCREVFD
jgi:hypothetical protein